MIGALHVLVVFVVVTVVDVDDGIVGIMDGTTEEDIGVVAMERDGSMDGEERSASVSGAAPSVASESSLESETRGGGEDGGDIG